MELTDTFFTNSTIISNDTVQLCKNIVTKSWKLQQLLNFLVV